LRQQQLPYQNMSKKTEKVLPMSSNEIAICIQGLSKCYQIYETPQDRLKQMIAPHLLRLVGKSSKQYFKEFWSLKDVSFEIKKGETVGIIGRNGSGKSTLLQLICGTLTATSGSVEVVGRVAALLELGAGFNPEFTGRENVFLNAAILGVDREVMASRLEKVIEFAGLGDHIDQPMRTYSSGMYARLAFAAAIHVDPAILIIDEALSVGDAGFQLKCMLRMRELQEQGVTILFVSHDTGSVIRLCDRALVLEQGRLQSGDQDPLKSVKLYEQITRNILIPTAKSATNIVGGEHYSNELLGIEETRLGSKEAEYLSVRFFGDDGKQHDIFRSGDDIEIRAIIRSDREFNRVVSGFTLKNRAGVDVWGDNTLYADYNLSLKEGLSTLSYRFKLHLPAGEYFLYIGLADISGERAELDQRWPVRRLSIISSRQVLGYVFAPATIELTTLNRP
jgi:ABC-type polysaccharide/polyol phosphate transport system ATPase subunit